MFIGWLGSSLQLCCTSLWLQIIRVKSSIMECTKATGARKGAMRGVGELEQESRDLYMDKITKDE
jgi:hypothetical protein